MMPVLPLKTDIKSPAQPAYIRQTMRGAAFPRAREAVNGKRGFGLLLQLIFRRAIGDTSEACFPVGLSFRIRRRLIARRCGWRKFSLRG